MYRMNCKRSLGVGDFCAKQKKNRNDTTSDSPLHDCVCVFGCECGCAVCMVRKERPRPNNNNINGSRHVFFMLRADFSHAWTLINIRCDVMWHKTVENITNKWECNIYDKGHSRVCISVRAPTELFICLQMSPETFRDRNQEAKNI